eukprot:672530-Pelagomonas_calceolata.AAC.7
MRIGSWWGGHTAFAPKWPPSLMWGDTYKDQVTRAATGGTSAYSRQQGCNREKKKKTRLIKVGHVQYHVAAHFQFFWHNSGGRATAVAFTLSLYPWLNTSAYKWLQSLYPGLDTNDYKMITNAYIWLQVLHTKEREKKEGVHCMQDLGENSSI